MNAENDNLETKEAERGMNISKRFWKKETKKYKIGNEFFNLNRSKSIIGKTMSNQKYVNQMKKNKADKKNMKELENQIKSESEMKKQVLIEY